MAPDSADQQAAVCEIMNSDAFNWGCGPTRIKREHYVSRRLYLGERNPRLWGIASVRDPVYSTATESVSSIRYDSFSTRRYDPVHYGVPEGSYATDPDGAARVLEFRTMVQ
eukprot:4794793-Pyramimonas_sp.AAC.1